MIVNNYIDVETGNCISSHIDEVTSHRVSDTVTLNNKVYIVLKIDEFEHYDYSSIVYIDYVKLEESTNNELL